MADPGLRRAKTQAGGGPCWALPTLVVVAAAGAAWGAAGPRLFSFPHPISNLAVSGGRVLVASGHCVYQLETTPAPSAAAAAPQLYCVNRTDAVNKILLPYAEEEGGRLFTCWTQPDGTCYWGSFSGPYRKGAVPPENKIMDRFVSCSPQDSSVGKMVYSSPHWFLVVARATLKDAPDNCTGRDTAFYILQENETRVGEDNTLTVSENLYFVDIFLWGRQFFFPCYYFSDRNVLPKMVIIPQDPPNLQYTQTALQCAKKTRILSSSQFSLTEGKAFWIGVFSSDEEQRTPTSTALCLFDLKQVLYDAKDCHFVDDSGSSKCVSYLPCLLRM